MNPEYKRLSSNQAMEKKPMACVRRVNLFRKEVRERLSEPGFEILVARAKVISEGRVTEGRGKEKTYYGSSMLTIDLKGVGDHIRDPLDVSSALKLKKMMGSDKRVKAKLRQIALSEAEKIAGVPLYGLEIEMSVEAEGEKVLVDLDVEAAIKERSKPRQMVLKTRK